MFKKDDLVMTKVKCIAKKDNTLLAVDKLPSDRREYLQITDGAILIPERTICSVVSHDESTNTVEMRRNCVGIRLVANADILELLLTINEEEVNENNEG